VILCFAGDIASHRRCKREEEEEADLDLPWRRSFFAVAREPTRRQWWPRVEQTRRCHSHSS